MNLTIYNTLTRTKEEFIPLMNDPRNKKTEIGIYSCGPTVYGDPHIGNLRAYVFADLLRNTIKHILGLPVKHVVNITDVGHLVGDGDQGEDKMEKGSRSEGVSARDIAKKYEENFKKYLAQLNIEPFDAYPRATQHIPEQIAIVQELEKKGYTYEIPGDGIYMDTSKIPDYGKLMGANYKKNIEGLQAGNRVEDIGKKNPTDFALRKFSPKDQKRQMERDSPWGVGFPGRHIECSAMSRAELGDHFDIHTGGIDHIPIHHTDEIAQSECSFSHDKQRVNYRMHSQFLNIDGEKISKSLGNVFSLPDIEAKGFDALDLRYFFLTAHYRSFQDFSRENLEAARKGRLNLVKKTQKEVHTLNVNNATIEIWKKTELRNIKNQRLTNEIIAGLLDDLETPKFFATLQTHLNSEVSQDFLEVLASLDHYVLRLNLFDQKSNSQPLIIPQEIKIIAQQRRDAKAAKDFAKADELRKQIEEAGYEMKDGKEGYELSKKTHI